MAKGTKTGGRRRGTPNKSTTAVKEALTGAFDNLGGVDSLVKWGKENLTEFYKLWVKVLPQEIHAQHSLALTHEEQLQQLADDAEGKGDTDEAA